jgi:uncharacterized membrane protein
VKLLDDEVKRLRQDLRRDQEPVAGAAGVPTSRPVAQPSPAPAAQAHDDAPAASLPWREFESQPARDARPEPNRPRAQPMPAGPQQTTSVPGAVAELMQGVPQQGGPVPDAVAEPLQSRPQQRPPMAGNFGAGAEFPPMRWVREFFTGGNAVVRVGVVILFFGVAFLLRYLAEHSRVPIEWRLAGIVLGGVALLIVGWRLRASRAAFALPLQGGGLGILYLTVFAALRLYALLPAALAFPILGTIAVLSAVLAVLQNSLSLALLGVAGGFLAPVLASTGEGSHVVLFSYYALLNAGILAMAWFKAWRPLNIVGFVFTFGIGTAWGVLRYRPELFASTEPFLVLYFLLYLTIAVLFTSRQPVNLTGYIDGVLVFGTPIVVFVLQSSLLRERLMPLAYSAVAMSAVYLALAWLLRRRRAASQALLVEAFIAIGVALLTLAVPLALNARWNVAAWSLEATALIWVGCRQRRVLARLAGILLSLACGLIGALQFDLSSGQPLLPLADYAGVVLQSIAAIVGACILHRHRQQLRSFEQPISTALLWWGLGWWSAGGVSEIAQHWSTQELAGILILLTFTTQVCGEIHRRVGMAGAKVAALLQLPLMLLVAVVAFGSSSHPAAAAGWLGWPLAFIGLYALMYRLEGAARGPVANLLNTGATWLLCGMCSWEAAFQVGHAVVGSDVWSTTAWVLIPLVVLGLLRQLVTRVAWPFAKNRDAYLFLVGAGIAVFLFGWSVAANLSSLGDFAPLPYCPLLNPLDVTQACVLLVLWRYWRFSRAADSPGFPRIDRRVPMPALAALTFLWLNAMLLRTLHQWFGVASGWDALLQSTLVQTSLSIFWALLAFLIMLTATRRHRRIVWLAGAALLGVVIAKLFLVDLSRVGSIERIVSFVGVGLLMLVIGYISPLPPEQGAD